MQGKTTIAVGAMLGALSSHGPALEEALCLRDLFQMQSRPAYSISIDGRSWVNGLTDQVVPDDQLDFWACPYMAIAVDVLIEHPEGSGIELPVGSVTDLRDALRDLGARFLIGTRDHQIYWFAIDVENDADQLLMIQELLRRHSMIFYRPEDDPELGRIFGMPYKGQQGRYMPA